MIVQYSSINGSFNISIRLTFSFSFQLVDSFEEFWSLKGLDFIKAELDNPNDYALRDDPNYRHCRDGEIQIWD